MRGAAMSEFYVGQKVVCVDATGLPAYCHPLKQGSVYTIREIVPGITSGTIGIRLKEIILRIHPIFNCEEGYRSRRFRPVEYKAMSIFRKIARDVTEGAKSDLELAGSGGLR